MEEEIWKVHHIVKCKCFNNNYERVYEVSNQGRVRINGVVQQLNNNQTYYKCGKAVHRMVAECFIPNPTNKPEVDHINGDKHDNRAVNLRWVTKKENANNPITKELVKKENKRIAIECNARPEVKAKQRERRLSWWATATDEQKAIRNKKVSEGLKAYHKKLNYI